MEPLTTVETDQLTGIFGTGGTAIAINLLHMACNSKIGTKIFHKLRWFVKPLVLLAGTAVCGVIGAFASGLDARTALAACVAGLLSSILGPAWKGVWAEAEREFEEEEAEAAQKPTDLSPPAP